MEQASAAPLLEPVLTYQGEASGGLWRCRSFFPGCGSWRKRSLRCTSYGMSGLQEIQAQVMGEVQIEILKSLIQDRRFGVAVELGPDTLYIRKRLRIVWKVWDTLNRSGITPRSICCWSRQSGEAGLQFASDRSEGYSGSELGRGLCSPIWRKRSTEAC